MFPYQISRLFRKKTYNLQDTVKKKLTPHFFLPHTISLDLEHF